MAIVLQYYLPPDFEPEEPDEPDLPEEELEPDPEDDPDAPPELLDVVDLFALVLADEDDEEDPDFEDPFWLSFLVAICKLAFKFKFVSEQMYPQQMLRKRSVQ